MVAQNTPRSPLFALGKVVATPGALAALVNDSPSPLIARHVTGDWGDVGADDAEANDQAIAHEGNPDLQSRVLSAYKTISGVKLWIITEADRSSTCVLLPSEY